MNVRRPLLALIVLLVALTSLATPPVSVRSRAVDAYANLPLRFERNDGQTAAEVEYFTRGRGSALFLTRTEAVLALSGRNAGEAVLRLRMLGANAGTAIAGEEQLQAKTNYMIGNDRHRWHIGVPSYRKVRYGDVWPGIDLVWHGAQNALEYDFVIAPGADPAAVRMQIEGAKRLHVDGSGNLIAETAAGDIVQRAPVLYQDGPNGRVPVAGRYVLRGRKQVAFAIDAYDRKRALIIDPILEYSTFLGGSLNEEAFGVAVDQQGNAFVTGPTDSIDFPKASLITKADEGLLFVAKLNADGTELIYSTLIGTNLLTGVPFEEGADTVISTGIAVTNDGKACITGSVENTRSASDYPVTDNAFQKSGFCLGNCAPLLRGDRGFDAFVTVLAADGAKLVYSTFYGATKFDLDSFDRGDAVAVDSSGHVYITGVTNGNDLATKHAFQNSRRSSGEGTDAFVAVFDPSQSHGDDTLLYASYLGGTGDDRGLGIAVDPDRNAYVAGKTASNDLETIAPPGQSLPPFQAGYQGGSTDGFIAKIDTESSSDASLTYLTYFGGNLTDRIQAVAVDTNQRAYIAGASNSSPATFPLVNAFDSTQLNGEAFVAKINADGTALFYSTFLGGDNDNTSEDFEEATGIAIDGAGNVFVAGNTTSGDTFPAGTAELSFPPELTGTAFVAKIAASTSATAVPPLLYSTTFGGKGTKARDIAVRAGDAYLAGFTDGELPATTGAFQTTSGGGRDAFVARVAPKLIEERADTTGLYNSSRNEFQLRNSNTTGGADLLVSLGVAGDLPLAGDWDGDGVTDVGVFRGETSQFVLRLTDGTEVTIVGGGVGDLPIAGDWDGDGFDTLGFFHDAGRLGQSFFLTNVRVQDSAGPDFDIIISAGQLGDLPVAGDWDGDGLDTIGFYRPSTSTFFEINDLAGGVAQSFAFGTTGDLPLAGDWDGNDVDDVGVFRASDSTMHLTTDAGVSETFFFVFKEDGDSPVGGNWDGP